MPEWSIGPVSKTGEPSRVPWVRIPPSPPTTPEIVHGIGVRFALRTGIASATGEKWSRKSMPLCYRSSASESVDRHGG